MNFLMLMKSGLLCFYFTVCNLYASSEQYYNIYLDADFGTTKAAGLSIKQGIETALDEVNNHVNGYQIKLIIADHRANSLRSRRNLEKFLKDPRALTVFSGLHSPPLLANKQFINENKILLLDPWAAAGPITRSADKKNWIFRLSIDDRKAGYVIADHALREGFKKPYLLLEDTGWGKSNEETMSDALAKAQITDVELAWFNWGVGKNQASLILRNIIDSEADVIFFVGNAPEGKTFAQAMAALPVAQRLAIRSHWGITGGNFSLIIDKEMREKLDLQFIQSSFSFIEQPLSEHAQTVLERALKLFPEMNSAYDIQAPTGFIHAYDLTLLLISAMNQVKLTGDNKSDRLLIKNALEDLNDPVNGLIKTYQQPFQPYSLKQSDAHEALDISDYLMGYYGDKNEVILINTNDTK